MFDAAVPADDPRLIEAMAGHYRWVCHSWAPNCAACIGLGRMYVDDERFARNYERAHTGLAAYMRDGMRAFAEAHLS